jgi:hypothetical protein
MTLLDHPSYHRCHAILHYLWSKQDGARYDAKEWEALRYAIELLARPSEFGEQELKLDAEIERIMASGIPPAPHRRVSDLEGWYEGWDEPHIDSADAGGRQFRLAELMPDGIESKRGRLRVTVEFWPADAPSENRGT